MKIYDLKCDHSVNPVGVGCGKKVFGWKIESSMKNTVQTAYRLVVEGVFDSGKTESDNSVSVCVNCDFLPETKYNYSVTVWDNYGNSSSQSGFFETGIGEWSAKWIEPQKDVSVYKFIKKFSAGSKNAKIYASAFGLYDIYINGKRAGDRLLTPGFTSYFNRVQYQTYDVLLEDENEIEVHLARGWCAGRYPFQSSSRIYCDIPSFIAEIHFGNEKIITDETWECTESKLRFSEIYDGEIYDSLFETDEKIEVCARQYSHDILVPQESEAVRIVETRNAEKLFTAPNGDTILDFGQNMSGFVEFTVSGKKGEKVVLEHAEVLDKDGNFYTENLRSAQQRIEYILSGEGDESYHSRFSFQGFRYVCIKNYPGTPKPENFRAHVICTDMNRIGYFRCSDDNINRLYSNIIWGQKGNFIDIPTDCPQRDERVGWTGDAQVFCATAATNYDTSLFFKKWLRDMAADSRGGMVQIFVPAMEETKTSSAWGDAATICPWQVYMASGDTEMLREQYPLMKNWVEYVKSTGNDPYLWDCGFQFGDWLGLDSKYGSLEGATDKYLIATAYFAYSAHLTSMAADELGYKEDAKKYKELFENIKIAFNREFVTPSGKIFSNTQTAYVLALAFDLTDKKSYAAGRLAELIKNNGGALSTGFVGTPYICLALAENGYEKTAYDLLLRTDFPSWLFSVKMGATTVWEHWDGINEDGDMWSKGMNSFNHYAYGSVAEFLYKKCAGISPARAGYKRILIKPVSDERIPCCFSSIDTPYGVVSAEICSDGKLKVSVPPNTSAEIVLKNGISRTVGSGNYEFDNI